MTGAGFEDFNWGIGIVRSGWVCVDIEEGDDEVGIM